jgi:hypothetical protein
MIIDAYGNEMNLYNKEINDIKTGLCFNNNDKIIGENKQEYANCNLE